MTDEELDLDAIEAGVNDHNWAEAVAALEHDAAPPLDCPIRRKQGTR
jgi:hypothetical protein